jgi:hypothetical protein
VGVPEMETRNDTKLYLNVDFKVGDMTRYMESASHSGHTKWRTLGQVDVCMLVTKFVSIREKLTQCLMSLNAGQSLQMLLVPAKIRNLNPLRQSIRTSPNLSCYIETC